MSFATIPWDVINYLIDKRVLEVNQRGQLLLPKKWKNIPKDGPILDLVSMLALLDLIYNLPPPAG